MDINQAASILEVSTNISEDELKTKFKKLVMKYHPDRNKDEDTTSKFIEIKEAYEALKEYVVLGPVPTIKWKPTHFWSTEFNFVNPYPNGSTSVKDSDEFIFTFSTS